MSWISYRSLFFWGVITLLVGLMFWYLQCLYKSVNTASASLCLTHISVYFLEMVCVFFSSIQLLHPSRRKASPQHHSAITMYRSGYNVLRVYCFWRQLFWQDHLIPCGNYIPYMWIEDITFFVSVKDSLLATQFIKGVNVLT